MQRREQQYERSPRQESRWADDRRYRSEDDYRSSRREFAEEDFERERGRGYGPGQGGDPRFTSREDRRSYGGGSSYRDPYTQRGPVEPDYGYRPEPGFERQYRESYRPGEARGQHWEERSRWENEQDENRRRERYRGSQDFEAADHGPDYSERRSREFPEGRERDDDEYNRREPMREHEQRGGYYSGRGSRQEERFERPANSRQGSSGYRQGAPEYGGNRREGEMRRSGESFRERNDDRGQYEEWLEEHRGRDRGGEGDRQLEGLRDEHRSHHSDERYNEREGYSQPRSRRRVESKQPTSQANRGSRSRPTSPMNKNSTGTKASSGARNRRSR